MTSGVWRRLALALVLATAATLPASAQFWERSPFWERQQPQQPPQQQQQTSPRDYFPFRFFGGDRGPPSFNPFGQSARPAPVVDSSKAPPPHKVDTPPTSTILVIGDSLADWLGYGLEEAFSDTPEIGIVRKIRPASGLVRYEARNESIEWWQAAKDSLATDKPNAIVVMLGLNDRQSLRERAVRAGTQHNGEQGSQSGAETAEQPAASSAETQRTTPGGSYEFHTDKWNELYGKRVDEMIAVLKSKGVPVVWVGLPAIRGAHATGDMSYLDEIFRARAEKAGITYVDVWDGFVDENGRYAVQGPDFEGQTRRLRSGDGVHFTKAGAVKLAHYVEHELRRLMSNHVVPVALPAPEEHAAPNAAAVVGRPAVGPIVPLNAAIGGEASLLGAGGRIEPAKADPVVKSVLSRGDAIVAPAGRADDFSWPRADVGAAAGSHAAIDAGSARQPPIASAASAPPSAGKSDNRTLLGADAIGGPQAAIQSTPDAATPIAAPAPSAKGGDERSDVKKLPSTGTPAAPQATSQAAISAPHVRRHHPRTNPYGAPLRPPLPVGPAAANTR